MTDILRDIRQEEIDDAFKRGLICAENAVIPYVMNTKINAAMLALWAAGCAEIGETAMSRFIDQEGHC